MPLEWRRSFFKRKKRIIYFTTFSRKNQIIFWSKPPSPSHFFSFDNFHHFWFLWHVYKVTLKHIFKDSKSTSCRESISSQQHQHSQQSQDFQTMSQTLSSSIMTSLNKETFCFVISTPLQWWFSKDNSKRHLSVHFTCVVWFVIILPTYLNQHFSIFYFPPTSTHSNTTIHVLFPRWSPWIILLDPNNISNIFNHSKTTNSHRMKHVSLNSLNSFTCIAQLSHSQIVSILVVLFW
jgi:hypothetical protein